MLNRAGTVQVVSHTEHGPLKCVRLQCKTNSSGDAIEHFPHGLVNGELRKLVVNHKASGVSDTISVYLYDQWDNSLLAGEAATGMSANATTKKLLYEEIGSVQARGLYVGGYQQIHVDLSGSTATMVTLEFWYLPGN